jgi:putative transport protein
MVFRIRVDEVRAAFAAAVAARRPPVEATDFEVTAAVHAGTALRDHPLLRHNGIILSRLKRGGAVTVPSADTVVQVGDVYRAVGPRDRLSAVIAQMGRPAVMEWGQDVGGIRRMDLVVTRTAVLRRPLRDLDLIRRTGVTVARVNRAGIDLVPTAALRLVFGDRLIVVGAEAGLKMVEAELGNCHDSLNRPQLVPIFLGIVLGVTIGIIPIAVPGMHAVLRIGLAGGPLLAAILLSQLGNIGSIVWYMPSSSNQLFRDFGLAVFLACVGLRAGDHFWQRAVEGGGLALLGWGAVVTMLPVFLVGCFARAVLRMNFVTLSGWVAGAMTNSTSLLFAGEATGSDAPAVAYAAVAPLSTLVPIICAQVLAVVGG